MMKHTKKVFVDPEIDLKNIIIIYQALILRVYVLDLTGACTRLTINICSKFTIIWTSIFDMLYRRTFQGP